MSLWRKMRCRKSCAPMIKRILLVSLWTASLSVGAGLVTLLLCAAYTRATLPGAAPDKHQYQIMENIWMYAFAVAQPIALLLGLFGVLPGTRLKPNYVRPSGGTMWCYRVSASVALVAVLISVFWDSKVWDALGIACLVFALCVAVVERYTRSRQNHHRPS
jgi:hypothetical protein